jgi:hypothetical protein
MSTEDKSETDEMERETEKGKRENEPERARERARETSTGEVAAEGDRCVGGSQESQVRLHGAAVHHILTTANQHLIVHKQRWICSIGLARTLIRQLRGNAYHIDCDLRGALQCKLQHMPVARADVNNIEESQSSSRNMFPRSISTTPHICAYVTTRPSFTEISNMEQSTRLQLP